MYAVILDAVDYKMTFAKSWKEGEEEEQRREVKACHLRSAKRLLRALEVS